jgi:ketopantoate reductase
MRHAVLGAGGVSGLVEGALAQTGHPATLLVRPGRSERVLPGTSGLKPSRLSRGEFGSSLLL